MKKLILSIIFVLPSFLEAQNVGIGTNNPLSKLHVAGDVRIDALAHRDSGIISYNQSGVLQTIKFTGRQADVLRGDGTFHSVNATTATSTNWLTTGNSGIDSAIHFLGTTDNSSLHFRVNNIRAGEINPINDNISLGMHALQSNSMGFRNIAIGVGALSNTKEGFEMVAIGDSALFGQTTATYGYYMNTAVGSKALKLNKHGYLNTALGYHTLMNNYSQENTAIGAQVLSSNTGGSGNTGVGSEALMFNTMGMQNCAIGAATLARNTMGNRNCAIGVLTLSENTTGSENTGLGTYTMGNNRTGNYNTAVGSNILHANLHGSYNTAIGAQSLSKNTVSNQTAIGFQSLFSNTIGENNTSTGFQSLYSNTIGDYNTATGFKALYTNNSGSNNVAYGYQALAFNTTGSSNVAAGSQALTKNITGLSNTAGGTRALANNISGVNNSALGYGSLMTNTTGSFNTGMGMYADVTSGNFTNATAIGYNAKVNASNKVRIGNSAVTKIEGQVPFSTPSDGRYKFNVREDVSGLAFIMKLRPVTYQFDVSRFDNIPQDAAFVTYNQASEVRRTGFIAQEVQAAAQEADYDFSGIGIPQNAADHYSLSYESFVVPVVKAVQEQQNIILSQKAEILQLEKKSERDLIQLKDEIRSQQQQIDLLLEEIKILKLQTSK